MTGDVVSILAPGQDPHVYEIKATDTQVVARADLCLENGWHLEGKDWMKTLAKNAGKPLITTHVGGIPEIYGPLSPTLIPAGDPLKLAEAIARAIREPEVLADTTRLLRQRVADSFSVETMVDGILAAYEQALSRGPAHDNAAVAHA